MKKITFLTLLCILTLSSIAQNKFGYIDSQELMSLMPESKEYETKITEFAKSLEQQLSAMEGEREALYIKFQNNAETYTDLVKQDKETEFNALNQRVESFKQNAQIAVQNKQQELLEPILAKARKAIEDVATEGGYTYIFDRGNGTILYAKESENVLLLVKKKLGL